MKALFKSIMELFETSGQLLGLNGRLFLFEAEEDSPYPYCVYMMESDRSDYTFDTTHHEVAITFILTDSPDKAVRASDLTEELTNLYDDCELEVDGYRFSAMERQEIQLLHEPGDDWQYMVQYKITLEEE